MKNEPFIYVSDSNINKDFLSNSLPVYKSDNPPKYINYVDKEDYYHFHHGCSLVSNDNKDFIPHYHPVYEIFIYIKGKSDFRIGSAVFRLNPYDIIIIPPYTIHNPIPTSGDYFERYVINIFPDFFQHMDCPQYQDVLLNLSGFKYKIPGHTVQRSNIISIIDFLSQYDSSSKYITPLLDYKIAELMYYINTIEGFEGIDFENDIVKDIISYINTNFDTITKLQDVTDNFYYTKNYINKLFKKSTGITIPRYVNIKKMENVERLCKKGNSLTHSCIKSGFTSYNNFAYTYKKEFGICPKKGLGKGLKI